MSDFGTTALNPTAQISGLIGKIAKTVIEGESVPNLFSGVHKGTLKYGKYLEMQLRKAARGVLTASAAKMFDEGGFPVNDSAVRDASVRQNAFDNYTEKQAVLYFSEWVKKSYDTIIDYDDIDEGSQDESVANEQAAKIVDALYQGATKDANKQAFTNLAAAIATASTASKAIVNVGSVAEVSDITTADAWLALVKKIAKKVRRGSGAVNPADNTAEVPAQRVIMVTPADNITGVDVYKRAPSPDNEYTRFDVDEVIEYDPDRYPEMNGATVIADERYFQFYEKEKTYRENDALMQGAAGPAVLCTLATRDMYALCPLFNAAVIGQE
jgi:hypothetical protein